MVKMTVSELFKKFRCCKPAPILPTTQIQTTSYTYQLAFVQWALEYVLSITEGYEERTSELETRATSVERAITQLQEGIDPILVDIEDLDDRVTALENGGGGLPPSYFKGQSVGEEADTNPYIFTGLTTSIADPEGNITLSDGKIKIGNGVSVIGISSSVAVVSARSSTYYEAILLQNNIAVAYVSRTTNATNANTETFEIPTTLLSVNPGDEFTVKLTGGQGEVCNVRISVLKVK